MGTFLAIVFQVWKDKLVSLCRCLRNTERGTYEENVENNCVDVDCDSIVWAGAYAGVGAGGSVIAISI